MQALAENRMALALAPRHVWLSPTASHQAYAQVQAQGDLSSGSVLQRCTGSGPIVNITALRKAYGNNEVLKEINLHIAAGEVVTLLGESGSGKSTLLRCINGLEPFQDGEVAVDGMLLRHDDPATLYALRQQVGLVAQRCNLFSRLTVGGNIMLAPTVVKKTDRASAEERARKLLIRVGLAGLFDTMPAQLSRGQQQRAAIARAIAMNPAVLLCDAITAELEAGEMDEVHRILEGLAKDGMTILMVTDALSFARKIGDRVVFLHQGAVHEMGPPGKLFSQPETLELTQYLTNLKAT